MLQVSNADIHKSTKPTKPRETFVISSETPSYTSLHLCNMSENDYPNRGVAAMMRRVLFSLY